MISARGSDSRRIATSKKTGTELAAEKMGFWGLRATENRSELTAAQPHLGDGRGQPGFFDASPEQCGHETQLSCANRPQAEGVSARVGPVSEPSSLRTEGRGCECDLYPCAGASPSPSHGIYSLDLAPRM
ncbi:hypothetical protein SKAU_G00315440 [Synaphobranchus kaupii]|uniref:Uncharacterized protein n=1 Tax=Synaphobranchus kaupii TaxID=118154 RepID=A0A9Q1ILS6_SYNKA|nr:hypothetical protein SKAU_G00315440 [Synaphobranchus kaupii]